MKNLEKNNSVYINNSEFFNSYVNLILEDLIEADIYDGEEIMNENYKLIVSSDEDFKGTKRQFKIVFNYLVSIIEKLNNGIDVRTDSNFINYFTVSNLNDIVEYIINNSDITLDRTAKAQNEQKLPKTEKGYNTYFANNLTVIKDNALYKVLFKLTSLQMKEYNKAVKHNLPTNNITFQYSLNEFRMDLQMGKSTIIKKFDILNNIGLLSITKNCDEKNGYCKNTYQLNINKLNEIISKLNGMRRLQRIEYINNIFGVITSKSFTKIDEGKFDNEASTPVLLNEDTVEDKIEEVKASPTLTSKERYCASSSNQSSITIDIPITKEEEQEVAINNMTEQMKNLNTTKEEEQNNEYDATAIKWTRDINQQRNTSYYSFFKKQVEAKQMTVEEANIAIQQQDDKINGIQPTSPTDTDSNEDTNADRLQQQRSKLSEMLDTDTDDEYSNEVINMFDNVMNRYSEQRVNFNI